MIISSRTQNSELKIPSIHAYHTCLLDRCDIIYGNEILPTDLHTGLKNNLLWKCTMSSDDQYVLLTASYTVLI